MKIIEGQTSHELRQALASHLKAEGQLEDGLLWAAGSVVLRCQRPAELWDIEPTTSPLDIMGRWLGYAVHCETGIMNIAGAMIGKQRAAAYTDLGGDGGQRSTETLAYLAEGSDVRCLWTSPLVGLDGTMSSVGLHLELLAAAAGKRQAGVERLVGFARAPQEEVERVLGLPTVPTVPCPPLISTPLASWLSDLDTFLRVGSRAIGYKDPFFRNTAVPLHRSMVLLDQGAPQEALVMAATVAHDNWRYLAERWILGHQTPSGSSQ